MKFTNKTYMYFRVQIQTFSIPSPVPVRKILDKVWRKYGFGMVTKGILLPTYEEKDSELRIELKNI